MPVPPCSVREMPSRQGFRVLWRVLLVLAALSGAVKAQTVDDRELLFERLRLAEVADALIREGAAYGDSLHADMIPGIDAAEWQRAVGRIYDRDRLLGMMRQRLDAAMQGQELSALLAYFGSDAGREVIALELSARDVLADPALLQASADRYRHLLSGDAALTGAIARMVRAGDLIERNVAGTLGANLMFYRGMKAGGALAWSDDQLIREVWAQEPVVREEAADWIYGFSLLAYEPLSAVARDAYADLWETPEGRALNAALFAAYDEIYAEVSFRLGQAVARYLVSEAL